jgi:hypothetical protein
MTFHAVSAIFLALLTLSLRLTKMSLHVLRCILLTFILCLYLLTALFRHRRISKHFLPHSMLLREIY